MVQVRFPRTETCIRRRGSRLAAVRLRAYLVAAVIFAAPSLVSAQVLSGSYTGDGTDGRTINMLGFQPDVVIVKGDTTQIGVIRTSSMTGDNSKPMTGATALTANLIESLISTGFTIGNDARVNANGTEYYWIAFRQGSKRLKVGSYAGNGNTPRGITGVGFSPEFVIILSAGGSEAIWRSSADTECFDFASSNGDTTWISSLDTDGFTVNNDARVNANGTTYHYIAWNEVAGVMDVGTYTGDNGDGRDITSPGFRPEYVFIKADGNEAAVHHPASLGAATDSTLNYTGAASAADKIQALNVDGFNVGADHCCPN